MSFSRESVCSFTFADGRRCRTPRSSAHPYLCYFHAKKEAESAAREEIGSYFADRLNRDYLSARDLSVALGGLFAAGVQGKLKPKAVSSLAYLGQVTLQAIQLSAHEFISAFGPHAWRAAVASGFTTPKPESNLNSESNAEPAPSVPDACQPRE